MAKEIYNKNAREKALLEEAYMNVYSETIENIHSPAMQATQAEDAAYKKYEVALHGAHIYDEPTPSPADYGLPPAGSPELEEIANRADPKNHPMAANLGYSEDQEFEGAYVSGTEEVEPQPDLNALEGSIQAKKNPSVKYGWRVSTGEVIPSLEPNEQGQYAQEAPEGNIILTGHIKTGNTPDGEQWSQKPEKFEKDYKRVSDKEATAVGANPVAMRQMSKPFKVHTSWGSELTGKPGDLLTQYDVGDYGVLDQGAFNAYYVTA